MMEHE
jgi:hypothetical protein